MATVSTNEIIVQYKIGNPADLDKLVSTFAKVSDEEKESLEVLKQYGAQVQRTGNQAQSSFGKVNNELKDLKNNGNQFASSLKGIGGLIAGAFAIDRITAFGREVLKTTAQFENFRRVINFTSGGAEQGAIAFQKLVNISNQLGISLQSAVQGYKTISGAANQAGLSNAQTQRIFENASKAVAQFGLSSEDATGVFLALGQIISKGTVSAEELRGQIGERIPGAFAIAARSIGVTEAALYKMMQRGEVASKDFVIPFTEELGKLGEAADGANGATQKINRISNAFDILKTRIGRGLSDNASQVGNLLERALSAANKLLETTADRDAEIATRANTDAMKGLEKASVEALKNIVTNSNARLRALDAEFKAAEELAIADGKRTKEEDARLARMQDEYTYTKAFRDAAFELYQTKQNTTQVETVNLKLLEDQYKAAKNNLELEREFRRLQGELYNNPNAKLAADRTYYQGLEALQKEYAKKGLDISQAEITNTGLQRKIAAKELKQESDALFMDRYKQEGTVTAITADELKKRLEAQREAAKKSEEIDAELTASVQREAELRTQIITSSFDLANNLFGAYVQFRNSQLDNELVKVNSNAAEEVRLADGNAQKLQEIEQKRAAKEKEIRTKQFKAEQAAAVARVVFETASMVAKWASNPVTFPLAAIALANQAAQIGFILAQPVPEFAKGVENFQGGFAIVGEQGPELIKTPKGNMLSPGKPTLTYLPKGSDVITAPKTKEVLGLSSSYKKGQDKFVSVDVAPIAEAVRSIPVQSLHITERGLERFVQRGNRSTRILNKRRQEG